MGSQFDVGHVPHARNLPVRPGLEDDVLKLLYGFQASRDCNRVLKILFLGGRRLADDSGRHLHVLLANGLDDVIRRQAPILELIGVQPQPHAVIPRPEHLYVAYSVDAGEDVLYVDRGVIREKQVAKLVVLRVEVDKHDKVGGLLLRAHSLLGDFSGQFGQCQSHAVLHQHLSHVQIGPHLERNSQVVRTVRRADAGNVIHAFHAVDLLLDGHGDGVGDGLGVGAGIHCGNGYRRRRDIGIERYGQLLERHQPGQDDYDRDDRRQHRTCHNEASVHYGGLRLRVLRRTRSRLGGVGLV